MKKGYCVCPEWADEDCPMDNPNEEMEECSDECVWYRETEEEE